MSKAQARARTISVPDLPQDLFDTLGAYITSLDDPKGSLIHVLHRAQQLFGYLPMEVQLFVARQVGVSGAEVFGVISFYSYFTTTPRGKHNVSVCMGTACFVRGSDKLLDRFKEELQVTTGETTKDQQFTLSDVRCLGACGLAPIVTVDDKVFGHAKPEDVEAILKPYRAGSEA